MYGCLIAAAIALFVTVEVLLHGAKVPRQVGLHGAYPVLACALVGGVAEADGQSPFVYSSMYALALFCGFLGPIVAALIYGWQRKLKR